MCFLNGPFTLILLSLVCGLTGCSTGWEPNSAADAGIHLTATLTSPIDVELKWMDTGAAAAGHTAEVAIGPHGTFNILDFFPPDEPSYAHSHLMPETTFHYRVRPYYGPASEPVEITTGKELPEGALLPAIDDTWSDPKSLPDRVNIEAKSIRNPLTMAQAAPTGLKAVLVHPTGILLTWTDHASDEDGYLLEVKPKGGSRFRACALMDSNVTSYGYALVPPETTVLFRVRAFYYGKPSNVVSQRTGLDPTMK